ncbi:hypothetical protein J3R83DRAFT_2747 [Lanmaoa asiatica]|nr:hypothetical protein J3R83DRAFT_2747 [Lanmaoa asiatica]
MTCHTTKSHPKTPTDIVTYRYNGELVYVPVAPNYIQALSHAREAFPPLKKLRDASLSLSLTAPGHSQKFVGISASAWPKLIAHMSRYQIIDVQATQAHERDDAVSIPSITITYADADDVERTEPVPPYCRSDIVDDEKASYPHPPSPSPSPPTVTLRKTELVLPKAPRTMIRGLYSKLMDASDTCSQTTCDSFVKIIPVIDAEHDLYSEMFRVAIPLLDSIIQFRRSRIGCEQYFWKVCSECMLRFFAFHTHVNYEHIRQE